MRGQGPKQRVRLTDLRVAGIPILKEPQPHLWAAPAAGPRFGRILPQGLGVAVVGVVLVVVLALLLRRIPPGSTEWQQQLTVEIAILTATWLAGVIILTIRWKGQSAPSAGATPEKTQPARHPLSPSSRTAIPRKVETSTPILEPPDKYDLFPIARRQGKTPVPVTPLPERGSKPILPPGPEEKTLDPSLPGPALAPPPPGHHRVWKAAQLLASQEGTLKERLQSASTELTGSLLQPEDWPDALWAQAQALAEKLKRVEQMEPAAAEQAAEQMLELVAEARLAFEDQAWQQQERLRDAEQARDQQWLKEAEARQFP